MSFLFKTFSTAPLPSLPRPDATLSFSSPAFGDAFDFTVTVRLFLLPDGRRGRWSPDPEETTYVGGLVRQKVRVITREHSIFEPAKAEKAINDALDDHLAEAARDPSLLISRWSAKAELALPDEAKKIMREHLNEIHKIRAKAEETRLRAEELRKSGAAWERFLTEATRNAFTPHAVRLTGETDAAEIVEKMIEIRRKDAEQLLTLAAKVATAQQQAGLYELVVTSENALRRAFELLGVPLPPPEPDSLFASLDEPA